MLADSSDVSCRFPELKASATCIYVVATWRLGGPIEASRLTEPVFPRRSRGALQISRSLEKPREDRRAGSGSAGHRGVTSVTGEDARDRFLGIDSTWGWGVTRGLLRASGVDILR
jgi:hypothetical protein